MGPNSTNNSNNGDMGWRPDRYGNTTITNTPNGPSFSGGGVNQWGIFPGGTSSPSGSNTSMGNSSAGAMSSLLGGSLPSNPYGSSGNQTQDNVNLGQFDTLSQNQQNQSNNLMGNFGAQQGNFLSNYNSAIQSLPNYLQQYNQIGAQNNLPQLQQNANMLNTSLANIPQTYTQAVRGSDTDANQLQQIIGRKAYELSPAVTSANNALSTAQNATQQQMAFAQAEQQKELTPYATEASLLPQLQATQAGIFTNEQSNQLQGLINKINSGVSLTQTEMQTANQLAIAKLQAENAIQTATIGGNAQQNVAKIAAQNLLLGQGTTYYNPSTGQAYNPFVNVPSR